MGADLYILKKQKGNNQITGFQTNLEAGYFRDAYNDSSLLWKFDLSWWHDYGDLLDKSGNLSPKGAKRFLKMLKEKEDLFNENLSKLSQEDREYFENKYKVFKDFFNQAINLNSEIESSI